MNIQITPTEFENLMLLYIENITMKRSEAVGDKMETFTSEVVDKAIDNLLLQMQTNFSPKEKLNAKRLISEITSGKNIIIIT
jgi:hypothetical protein